MFNNGKVMMLYLLCFSIDWHPNNLLLAAGSSDFKARWELVVTFICNVQNIKCCDGFGGRGCIFFGCKNQMFNA